MVVVFLGLLLWVILEIMVDFDWGAVPDIIGLSGLICGNGFGFRGRFGCYCVVFCIWNCFELCFRLWRMW